ncbi:hypothetical protein GCM10025794_31430 [Massilia kyonggiensis]
MRKAGNDHNHTNRTKPHSDSISDFTAAGALKPSRKEDQRIEKKKKIKIKIK